MGKTNIKPHSKSQGTNFTEQICKQAQPKQVHQPTFSHHPSHSLQGEGGACGHKVSAAGGTPSCPPASLPSVFFKPCINFKVFLGFFFWPYHLVYGILIPPPRTKLAVSALQMQSLNHGATMKDPIFYLLPEQAGKQAHQWENTQTASRS